MDVVVWAPNPIRRDSACTIFSHTNNHDACNHASPSPPTPTRTGYGHYLIRRWRQVVGVRHVIGRVLIFYACWLRPRPCVRSSAPCVSYHPGTPRRIFQKSAVLAAFLAAATATARCWHILHHFVYPPFPLDVVLSITGRTPRSFRIATTTA